MNLVATKGNIQVSLSNDAEVKSYVAMGYDIYEGSEMIQAGRGKTVPYTQYAEALERIKELEELQTGKKGRTQKENPGES